MAHAVSVFFTRSQHIPPQAFLLALLLHALTVLALWWLPTLTTFELPTEEPIDVTIEQPPPPPPPAAIETPPPAQAVMPSSPPPRPPPARTIPPGRLGILPPTQANPTKDEPKAMSDELAQQPPPAPEQPPKPENPIQPPAPPTPEQPPQQAAVAPPPEPPSPAPVPAPPPPPPPPLPLPRLEQALPPLEAPPPPITASDFPKPVPPPPPPPKPQPPKPQPAPAPQHATAPPQRRLLPSPLSGAPQQRPPTDSQASAPATRFVNPANAATRSRAIDDYLWQVARQASQYRYYSNERREEGTVIARLTIARDGRLIGISIAQSSGFPVLDKGVLETFRAGAPYPRIPNDIPGDPVTFTLPVTSRYRQ